MTLNCNADTYFDPEPGETYYYELENAKIAAAIEKANREATFNVF